MADQKTIELTSTPGIKRDGTALDGHFYTDGEWVRFQRGKPKKIGGYRAITSKLTGPVRGVHMYPKQTQRVIHTGSPTNLEAMLIDDNGLGASIYDRTPAALVARTDYLWQFDTFFDQAGSNTTVLLAHPGRNLTSLDNDVVTPVYYGDVKGTSPLVSLGQSVDGGVVSLQPYVALYGSGGLVKTCSANELTNFTTGDSNEANVSATKIVKGLPVRGASQSPSALLWSLDSVIRMSFVGQPAVFRFDPVAGQSSILSSSSIIEYDGIFYWLGVDRFLLFNGLIRELPNQMNINWFFDNLNYTHRQKVWAQKVPRYGEIWWYYPRGESTECNDAIIYNIRENTWYDVTNSRSSGFFSQVFRFPVMADSNPEEDGRYTLWQHEVGKNLVKGEVELAIRSNFTTHNLSVATGDLTQESVEGSDRWLRIDRVEPDFNQKEHMSVEVVGREYPQSPPVQLAYEVFQPDAEKVDVRTQGRIVSLKFESDYANGDYEMGSVLITISKGDARQ